jgi:riboflavin kinase/FMN adenylyltransferase
MRHANEPIEIQPPLARSVVTIGKFFAVHRGHQALIAATVECAQELGATPVVLTFDRHPGEILKPGTVYPDLASTEERLALFEELGVEVAVVVPLTAEFLGQSADAFIQRYLVDGLRAAQVVTSDNFRFGRGAKGDPELLRAEGERLGFSVRVIEPVMIRGERVSSSRVQGEILAGDVVLATELLGRPYCVSGEVVRGQALGTQLGFPTANVRTPEKRLLPGNGVYAVRVEWDGEQRGGVANLGVRPTVGGLGRVLEAHLFEFDGDLYGREVRVCFLEKLRDEQRFPSVEALREQIARDAEEARGLLAGMG